MLTKFYHVHRLVVLADRQSLPSRANYVLYEDHSSFSDNNPFLDMQYISNLKVYRLVLKCNSPERQGRLNYQNPFLNKKKLCCFCFKNDI